ncbi:MAG: hypothetical protein SP1CHLAM54_07240 [Chlamydiia bacterium]|nr:hypothetical protein [Chlamydiia bacterium]MCH9615630.1 hypothetical protein [Chlamydiia bacterium]MCH9628967.1 hypothetical protein [Chlamydiia bacterium]
MAESISPDSMVQVYPKVSPSHPTATAVPVPMDIPPSLTPPLISERVSAVSANDPSIATIQTAIGFKSIAAQPTTAVAMVEEPTQVKHSPVVQVRREFAAGHILSLDLPHEVLNPIVQFLVDRGFTLARDPNAPIPERVVTELIDFCPTFSSEQARDLIDAVKCTLQDPREVLHRLRNPKWPDSRKKPHITAMKIVLHCGQYGLIEARDKTRFGHIKYRIKALTKLVNLNTGTHALEATVRMLSGDRLPIDVIQDIQHEWKLHLKVNMGTFRDEQYRDILLRPDEMFARLKTSPQDDPIRRVFEQLRADWPLVRGKKAFKPEFEEWLSRNLAALDHELARIEGEPSLKPEGVDYNPLVARFLRLDI